MCSMGRRCRGVGMGRRGGGVGSGWRLWVGRFASVGVFFWGLGNARDGRLGWKEGGVGTDCVCSSVNPCVLSASVLSFGRVDRRNAMVGGGLAVRVEKRVILSPVGFGSAREEGVRMRNGWVVGRCCWVA